ncbi:MAG: methylenetetrahydrofolate reductase [NAD(P)H] [Bacteroidales bacterium]|nr:methylenetetrahydrofolate reductase [NAD(P)H] [Bacteroidales bacterium]
MKISQIITGAGKPFPSLEIVPPLRGITKNQLLDSIRPFMEFNPPYINVTSHRDEIEYVPQADGSFRKVASRKRISETAVCGAIMGEFHIETVPHLICGGADAFQIDNLLNDFRFLGISNLVALRGDCLTGEKRFTPTPGGYRYASELVEAVRKFDSDAFCIGVAAYPEKHFEAANLDTDIRNLKKKVDAGADYIITQMFFDNKVFYDFVDRCRAEGIDVPVIPGLKPISTPKQIQLLPEAFSLDIPVELTREIEKHAADKAAVYQIGQEWCLEQSRDLLAHGYKSVHYYTMGKADNVVGILRELF